MIKDNPAIQLKDIKGDLKRLWALLGEKIKLLANEYDTAKGSPVFTVKGKYTTRGWTEWTQGFMYGMPLIHYEITKDKFSLKYATSGILKNMAQHVSHIGVHDHGFNNVSTYGNLRRLIIEKKVKHDQWLLNFCELALKTSGAVQASRWSNFEQNPYIYSFNGPQSLFIDTIRSCRALVLAHKLGHSLMGENDKKISLLERACQHILTTAKYNVWYGTNRDFYDIKGRVAHESVFNTNDGNYRCPNSQQGYCAFTTWTRGLSWAMLGFAEELEALGEIDAKEFSPKAPKKAVMQTMLKAAKAVCDFYIKYTPSDGICYWDTGAPNLYKLGDDYLDKPAQIKNPYEPVDSSASAIAAQGLYRLGKYLKDEKYIRYALIVSKRLLSDDYVSLDKKRQGLLLHSIYHRPNNWDYAPDKNLAPYGESSMWGDYHLAELALLLQRELNKQPYYKFSI